MEFSKVFKHLTSFNINVGWYVHMLFLLVMNRFLVIGMIRHSARRRPDKRTMPRQRWKRAGEKFKPKLGSHTYIYTLFTYIHTITYHTIPYHYITLHTITYHYITYIYQYIIVTALMPQWTITTYGGYPETNGFNPKIVQLVIWFVGTPISGIYIYAVYEYKGTYPKTSIFIRKVMINKRI